MNAVQKELDSTKQVLFNNIDKINERGQRLDHLEQQTQDLSIQSRTFNQTAKKANRAMWWKNKKWTIAISILVIVILAGIIGGAIKGSH
ncbi:uncharacterized protein I206_102162 [Kwoniella pini CBS 10737]|uniref:V-SNARE coiled-coil homology domain-containing protein n=1 Tax=Kwoniella pini CBS 10737 TaxID=1296096 RepID=A0AAJ8MNP2_9TREE